MIPKFKVWDKKRSEMINLIAINFHKYIQMDDLTCSCEDGPITRNFQDVVLMQSTGLRDKNGVEIFEGDIVKFRDELHQIEFKSYRFKAKDFWMTYQDVPDDFFSEVAYKQCEVIGNVHENPELLGDRK